jgi:protein SCO1/2
MKNIKKTGILFIMLVLPVFVFLFLKVFGKNEYKNLPIYTPDNLANCGSAPLQLLLPDSSALTESALTGNISIIALQGNPTHALSKPLCAALSRAQERFSEEASVKIISLVLQPDSLAQLRTEAQRYEARAGKWTWAMGNIENKDFVRCKLALQIKETSLVPDKMLVLLDKEMRIRGYFDATNREEVDRLLSEIPLLLREYVNK